MKSNGYGRLKRKLLLNNKPPNNMMVLVSGKASIFRAFSQKSS